MRSADPGQGGAKVFTIPESAPFSATLAKGVLQRFGSDALALADITIYLPTRRAARSLSEVFAREAGGASLLPDFQPLGDVDEDGLFLSPDLLELKPAIAPLRRRLLLAALIRRWSHARDGGAMTFGQAAALAHSLAAVMDDTETQGAVVAKLDGLAPPALAEHWEDVKQFLLLIDKEWPPLLETEGCINPAVHRNAALRALAKRLQGCERPIVAAGSTGSIPATAELLGVIARLPKGAVVLPGLDRELDEESWSRLDPGHPQFTLKQLLERIGVTRDEVTDWSAAAPLPARETLLREVLRPAPTTDAWRKLADGDVNAFATGLDGLTLIEAAHPAEEAAAIALVLREALETPGRRAALVTRDRGLARRTAAELVRWNIGIDDSAGRPLSHTAPGALLCLIADSAGSGFAPVPLLAVLKHPLVTLGGDPATFRARARDLDLALRGVRPDGGLDGIARAIRGNELRAWFAEVSEVIAPLAALMDRAECALIEAINAHVAAAEALAPALWSGGAGESANLLVRDLSQAAGGLPDIEASSYAPLFRRLCGEVPVRPAYGRHPRLAILGPLEARLQSFDLIVLGGLNEGSWPAAAADDPWFSRPMRLALGLEQPERAIGLSAHDFAALACGPAVVLTRALKSEGTPTVASRWLQRLLQLTRGLGLDARLAPCADYMRMAATLADPGPGNPERPPYPRPPVAARPRQLSVTEIETWVRDPYAIYAKRVLRLRPLDPLDAEIGPLERGSALHAILERFVREHPNDIPPDALIRLVQIADEVFEGLPKATLALWRPRFLRAAAWFVGQERAGRAAIAESFAEIKGELVFEAPGGAFTLVGKADRIDRLKAGGGAVLDYKTGLPPSGAQVKAHLSPQLPLEGAILAAGGFPGIGPLVPAELVYVQVSGGAKPGEFKTVDADAAVLSREAEERLRRRIAEFDKIDTGYAPRVAPYRAGLAGDYDHLARVREWSLSGWNEDGE